VIARPKVWAIVWQAFVLAAVAGIVAAAALQAAHKLQQRGIASGFEFLGRSAEFEISRGLMAFSPGDTYGRAIVVGLFNTLRVALPGILVASVLGLLLGLARLSRIWIVATVARVYVEIFRNTPLLLQLLFWYSLSQALPAPRDALMPLPDVFLCFRGLFVPSIGWGGGSPWLTIERPSFAGFGFSGGTSVSPEFGALLIGLTTYTAAFLAEVVRGGVLAVDHGQTEAAQALGLSRGALLRLVILPQAWPIIIPSASSQFINLAKNSSLAVAIGYPDLVQVFTGTVLNQTGQAVEVVAITMLVYLTISLVTSGIMNWYNRRIALVER
jgi:general L-amino acid transport system permease protein